MRIISGYHCTEEEIKACLYVYFAGLGSNGDTVTEVTEDTALLSIFILT